MSDCVDRPLFLPDVLVPETMVLDMSLSGGTVYRLTIGKGSWFANALVFWLFICDQLGADILNVYEEERGIVITPADEIVLVDGDFDPIESQVGGMFGLEDCYLPHSFFPSLPLAQYDKSTAAIDGSSRRAHNGTAYTVSGITQQMRTLKVLLDYRIDGAYQNDLLQRAKWLNLWRFYWRQGRSVSCYPIQDVVVTFGEILWNTRTAQWGGPRSGEVREPSDSDRAREGVEGQQTR